MKEIELEGREKDSGTFLCSAINPITSTKHPNTTPPNPFIPTLILTLKTFSYSAEYQNVLIFYFFNYI